MTPPGATPLDAVRLPVNKLDQLAARARTRGRAVSLTLLDSSQFHVHSDPCSCSRRRRESAGPA
jgi:hypothetical protein